MLVSLLLVIMQWTCGQQKSIKADSFPFNISTTNLTPGKVNDLYVLAKIWGFLKYFHPQVAAGKFDWDNELEIFLPGYINTKNEVERNDSLLSWIKRLGDVPAKKAGDYKAINKYKLMPDFSWISDKNLGKELKNKLMYILDNRQQGDQYYIKFYRSEGLNIPVFQHEKGFAQNECPPVEIRLIALYRFWNVIEYWYPYKYNLPTVWDLVLKEQLPFFLKANNIDDYTLAVSRLLATIHDGHGFFNSLAENDLLGYYYLPVRFKYVERNIIISSISNDSISQDLGLAVGDVIESINGTKADKIIEQKLPYTSGSNLPDQINAITRDLNRTSRATSILEINDGKKVRKVTVQNTFTKKWLNQFVQSFSYQRDSSLSLLKNDIAYLNMGKLTMEEDSAKIVWLLEKCSAVIIDARQNAVEDGFHQNPIALLENLLCNGQQPFIFSTGQPDFAGVFELADSAKIPIKPHAVRYLKPIVILINEEVKSVGEFMTMLFSKAPKAVVMGSTTSGTDGPVTNLTLPGVFIYFTGTGIYWANGDETQRVGIRPDIEVYPTIKGFRTNNDELLEKATDYLSQQLK